MTNATRQYQLDKILPAHRGQDTSDSHFNDNTQLIYLHAASLLRNLKLRYEKSLIYVRPCFPNISPLLPFSPPSLPPFV